MILGLPFGTFFFTFVTPVIAIIGCIIYGVTFKDDDKWKTIDDLFGGSKKTDKEA